jgi:hypothetical protein
VIEERVSSTHVINIKVESQRLSSGGAGGGTQGALTELAEKFAFPRSPATISSARRKLDQVLFSFARLRCYQ